MDTRIRSRESETRMTVGIDCMSFSTSDFTLPIGTLATARGIDESSMRARIGQDAMSVCPPDEDVVTLGVRAAMAALQNVDVSAIDHLFFATESAFDMSKASGLYLHKLLGLPSECRTVEFKQACYGGTAALQMAANVVRLHPNKKVLVVASDIARYGMNTKGEWTQGCGAVALLVTAAPRLLALDEESGYYSDDIMDFWHPNYSDGALVDGKYSVRMYLNALGEA